MVNQSFFASDMAIKNFQCELDKGSVINMIVGPKVYEEISSPWINEKYKKLIDNGFENL